MRINKSVYEWPDWRGFSWKIFSQIDRQTGRQTGRQTDRQTDRQTRLTLAILAGLCVSPMTLKGRISWLVPHFFLRKNKSIVWANEQWTFCEIIKIFSDFLGVSSVHWLWRLWLDDSTYLSNTRVCSWPDICSVFVDITTGPIVSSTA